MFANGPGVIYRSVKSNAIIWKYRSVLHGLTKTRKKRHTPWITSEKNLHSPWKTLFEYEPRDWKHDQRIHISVGYSVFSLSTVQLRVLFSVLSILIRSWVTWLYRRTSYWETVWRIVKRQFRMQIETWSATATRAWAQVLTLCEKHLEPYTFGNS